MCGFAGEFLLRPGQADLDLAVRMASRLRHRGPDEAGSFLSPDGRCAIGFERLAVIDPPGSHQPMVSPDGSLAVAFNGEIYNFRHLRQELAALGDRFLTAGDTEVLLHLYRRHHRKMLDHLRGMFAFALYDSAVGELLLTRDRLGQKPLWYAPLPDRIVFASEAKALLLHPSVGRQVDDEAISLYLTIGYVPAPRSIWAGIRKVPPGCSIQVSTSCSDPQPYWEPAPQAGPRGHSDHVDLVRSRVVECVESHLVSDVPLGALLSGGLDSSIVVAAMSRAVGRTGGVKTFTAGFENPAYDERPAATSVAQHCRTEHVELPIPSCRARDAADRIVSLYDEPFADSSALPTFLICQAARQYVKVALTGDGGDEVFAGYDRYRAMHLATTMPWWKYLAVRGVSCLTKPFARHDERSPLRRLIRFADALPNPPSVQYFAYRSLFGPDDLSRLLTADFASRLDLGSPRDWFCNLYEQGDLQDEVLRCQYHDLRTYLPDDLLVKTDIASMASSLELRAPFLDHDLVSLGLSLPVDVRLNSRMGKLILRQAFRDMLPAEILRCRKRGFGVPLDRWIRTELLDSFLEPIRDGTIEKAGILRPEAVAGLLNDHLSGRGDHRHRLWAILVFIRWLAGQG